jgi:hypothetical protein
MSVARCFELPVEMLRGSIFGVARSVNVWGNVKGLIESWVWGVRAYKVAAADWWTVAL